MTSAHGCPELVCVDCRSGDNVPCEWCQRICCVCMGNCYETPCSACGSTGYAEPDYEALGYQETRVWYDDLDIAASWANGCRALVIPGGVELLEGGKVAIGSWPQKDIRDATDNG